MHELTRHTQSRGVQNSVPLASDWHTLGGESKQLRYPDLGGPTVARCSNVFMRANQGHGDRFSGHENETLAPIDWTEFGDDSFGVHATFYRAWTNIEEQPVLAWQGSPHLARRNADILIFFNMADQAIKSLILISSKKLLVTRAYRLENIASRLEAITTSSKKLLVTKASRLEAIASRLQSFTTSSKKLLVTKASRLEAIASIGWRPIVLVARSY